MDYTEIYWSVFSMGTDFAWKLAKISPYLEGIDLAKVALNSCHLKPSFIFVITVVNLLKLSKENSSDFPSKGFA